MPEPLAIFQCNAISLGTKPPAILSAKEYQEAWIVAHAMTTILTNDEDDSKASAWFTALSHRILDFEDAHEASHGWFPLNPGGPEWTDGPKGSA